MFHFFRDLYILQIPIVNIIIGDFIGILSKLKFSFGGSGGQNDIDSKIDTAFSRSSPFTKPAQPSAPRSSVSERVLAGQDKFGSQFNQRPPVQAPAPSSSAFGQREDFGRFGDPDEDFKANPLDFNDDLDRMEPPKSPPPLQIRRDVPGQQGSGLNTQSFTSSPQASSLQDMNRPVGFPDSGSNIPERSIDSAANQGRELTYNEKRIFDEIEDIRAQNNEILRRIQRMESKLR